MAGLSGMVPMATTSAGEGVQECWLLSRTTGVSAPPNAFGAF